MPKIRHASIRTIHHAFRRESLSWYNNIINQNTLQQYCFEHGIAHMLFVDCDHQAETLLVDFSYAMARLNVLHERGARLILKEINALSVRNKLQDRTSFEIWETFYQSNGHILFRGNEHWGSERILLQLAFEYHATHISSTNHWKR